MSRRINNCNQADPTCGFGVADKIAYATTTVTAD
jgi:hypothetical protein